MTREVGKDVGEVGCLSHLGLNRLAIRRYDALQLLDQLPNVSIAGPCADERLCERCPYTSDGREWLPEVEGRPVEEGNKVLEVHKLEKTVQRRGYRWS